MTNDKIGMQKCKGQKFAEYEVLLVAVSVIQLWDLVPVESNLFGEEKEVEKGGWKHPGNTGTASGTALPKNDIRVSVKRRPGFW